MNEEITMSNDSRRYVQELEDRVSELEDLVSTLKSKLIMTQGKKHSKKELREMYQWDEQDVLFSDMVIAFSKEFLFPRYKFLGKNWMENSFKRNSFSAMVRRNLVVPSGITFDDAWHRIITPTIVKKYTDMRCNINNECRNAFMGEY